MGIVFIQLLLSTVTVANTLCFNIKHNNFEQANEIVLLF